MASGFDPSLSSFSSTCEGVAAPSSFYMPDAYGYSYRPRNGALVDEDLFMEFQPLYPETDIYPLSPMYESGLWEPHRMRAASEMIRQRNRTSSVTASIPRSYSSVDTEIFASPYSLYNPLPSTTLSSPVSSAADLPSEPVDLSPKKPQPALSSSSASSSLPSSAPPRSGQASSVSSGGQRSGSGSVASDRQRGGAGRGRSGSQASGASGSQASGRSGSQGGGHAKKRGNSEGEDVNVDKLRSGEDSRTCVMLRNLPNRYHMENLHNMLYEAVGDHYNIVSLPLDSDTHRNLGYCFVKFRSVDDLIRAYEHVAMGRRCDGRCREDPGPIQKATRRVVFAMRRSKGIVRPLSPSCALKNGWLLIQSLLRLLMNRFIETIYFMVCFAQ